MKIDQKGLLGLVVGGPQESLEKLVKEIERRKDLNLHFVKRASQDDFLLIVSFRKKGGRNGEKNAKT
ncbi:MAG: hypothetical protein QXM43_03445 [Desulfurococcaceae archaeon]